MLMPIFNNLILTPSFPSFTLIPNLALCQVRGTDPKTGKTGYYVREESISEDYPLGASLKRKKKSKGGKMKKVIALFVLLASLGTFAWYAGAFEEDLHVSADGMEDDGAEGKFAHGGKPAQATSALLKMGKFVCTTGMTGARIVGVAASVSSLVGAGLYTCAGEDRPAGKLGVVAFYSILLYLGCTRMNLGLCAMIW